MYLLELCLWLLSPSQGPFILFPVSPISASFLVSPSTPPPLQTYTCYLKTVLLHSKPDESQHSVVLCSNPCREQTPTLKINISSLHLWNSKMETRDVPTRFSAGTSNSILPELNIFLVELCLLSLLHSIPDPYNTNKTTLCLLSFQK